MLTASPLPRLGREKRGDGRGRGRQRGLHMHRAPFGESRHPRAVGPPGIVGAGGAPVIGGRGFGLGETRGRRRQLDDGFKLEPVAHLVRIRPRGQPRRACDAGAGRQYRHRGLVGESGCGKSTTAMMVMRLIDQTAGSITFAGEAIGDVPARKFAASPRRSRIQMVFQDPTESLNPRFTAARAIADPLLRLGSVERRALRARCEELARQVGLPLDLLDRFPHQLSGGQKARVGIARAIALKPDLVILDEPTAALDVSVQAVVLNLLQDLKDLLGMSYLFVSHDLNIVRLLCDRVIVMRAGAIVEQGTAEQVLAAPQARYTRDLLAAIPHPPV